MPFLLGIQGSYAEQQWTECSWSIAASALSPLGLQGSKAADLLT